MMGLLPAVLAAVLAGSAADAAQTVEPAIEAGPGERRTGSAAMLHALFAREWQRTLRESPDFASHLGDDRYADRWPDLSATALAASHAADREALAALETIPHASLAAADQLNYQLFAWQLRQSLAAWEAGVRFYGLQQLAGVHLAHELAASLEFRRPRDYEQWLARLNVYGDYVDQTIALLAEGARAGHVQPRIIIERVLTQLDRQLALPVDDNPYFAPFLSLPADWPEAERRRLEQTARAAVLGVVQPAYRRLADFLRREHLPASRDSTGISAAPGGAAYYRNRVQYYTTTAMTPDEIHALGLAEVARIHTAMQAVMDRVGFRGSYADFLALLRSDARFHYTDPARLLDAYMIAAKRLDPLLPKLFGRLPRLPYGVRPIPAASAPETTTAYYEQGSHAAHRPGWFTVNLYRPESRPIYEIPVLTAHEAVPGHHLQIALAREMTGLPEFRRYFAPGAFVEGWALYAERLGDEVGLYDDPYDKFGQLTYDMWRAVRLVVDTGIHALGWTREQAIDYFKAHAARSELDIVNEIDRYIAWPGQALAYKIGELKILELRRAGEQALGADFDLRAFHDALLGEGALPLALLETHMRDWIAAQVQAAAAAKACRCQAPGG